MTQALDPSFYHNQTVVDPTAKAEELGVRIVVEPENPMRKAMGIGVPMFWSDNAPGDALLVVEHQDLENDTRLLIWGGLIAITLARHGVAYDAAMFNRLLDCFVKQQLRVIAGGAQ